MVRVWVPDRPGALGAVASRIGAVRGDVIGIEILERGGGRAIDELVVQLPDATLVALLVGEIAQVDGVDVEDVRPTSAPSDWRLDSLETAALLVGAASLEEVLRQLVTRCLSDFGAEWAALIDADASSLIASAGAPPPPAWLAAFVVGTSSSAAVAAGDCGADDVAGAVLGSSNLAVIVGRPSRPFRSRERRQLAALARIAGLRRIELGNRAAVG